MKTSSVAGSANTDLNAAINMLAGEVPNGHLLASTGGCDLFMAAAEMIREQRAEIERLRDAINVDRSGLAAGLMEVRKLCEGWDPCSGEQHTTDTLRIEIGECLDQIDETALLALKKSGDPAVIWRIKCKGTLGDLVQDDPGVSPALQGPIDEEFEAHIQACRSVQCLRLDVHDRLIDAMRPVVEAADAPDEPNEPDIDNGLPIRVGDVWRHRFLRLGERTVLERLHDGWRMESNPFTEVPVYMVDHSLDLWTFVRRGNRDSPVQNDPDEPNADTGQPIHIGDVWRHNLLGERAACERLCSGWRMTQDPNGSPVYMFDDYQERGDWVFVRRGDG